MRRALFLLLLPVVAFGFRASWQSPEWIQLHDQGIMPRTFASLGTEIQAEQIPFWIREISSPGDTTTLTIEKMEPRSDGLWLHVPGMSLKTQHLLQSPDPRASRGSRLSQPILPDGVLDEFFCEEPMGFSLKNGSSVFRLFAPRAREVRFHLYAAPNHATPFLILHGKGNADGSFYVEVPDLLEHGMAWTWSVEGPHGATGWASLDDEFADPWATAVATRQDYQHEARSLFVDESFDWQDGDYQAPPRDEWIIYEAHMKDLVAGPAAEADLQAGCYEAFVEAKRGGLAHLKRLGITAVEFLPLQEFGEIEIDFKNPDLGIFNTWNPWEHNHWGYMTSHFLAPESSYSGTTVEGWSGVDGSQVSGLKSVVDACHRAGIAVVMDVVYNHVSQYDRNCFKAIDPAYYFHLNDLGQYASASGCGNDLRTERPMVRRLILGSVEHFVEAYHIDGFRFDLASMIDEETLRQLHAYFSEKTIFHAAEPWGGGRYTPQWFGNNGWAWWNDQYRVDLRGRSPHEPAGLLFGHLHYESSHDRLLLGMNGHVAPGYNRSPLQSVNYIAAHDDHGLGDWFRLALGKTDDGAILTDSMSEKKKLKRRLQFQALSKEELQRHKLAAIHLMTSAGIPMIHEGQEFARSKLIEPLTENDPRAGHIDHNSYEKDNATNWLDWRVADENRELMWVYKDLISVRKSHPELATLARHFLPANDVSADEPDAFFAWVSDDSSFVFLMNTSEDHAGTWTLPATEKVWDTVYHTDRAGQTTFFPTTMVGETQVVELKPLSACLLRAD